MSVQFCLYHPPGCEGEHRRQGTQGKLVLNWTGPYKILVVGPCTAAETPDGSPLRSKLLHLDLPSDLIGSDVRRPVIIERCKPCANPRDSGDMPKYLPAGLTQYVLNKFSKKSPPYHVTQDDVSTPLQRLEVEQITGHQSVRGRGGAIAVLQKDALGGTLRTFLGAGNGPPPLPLPHLTLLGRNPGPAPPNQPPLPPNADRGGTAQVLPQQRGTFPSAIYACVPRADWLRRYHDTVLPKEAQFWYKGDDGLWWLGKISASTTEDKVYLVRFLDNPRPIKLPLPPAHYTISTGAVRGSWCLQVHIARAFSRGIQHNVDESRGAAVPS